MYRLQIKAPNSVLSVVLDREITADQASIIAEVLDTPSLTYGDAFDFLTDQRQIARITESEARALDGNR